MQKETEEDQPERVRLPGIQRLLPHHRGVLPLEQETCLASSPADIVALRCGNDPNCACYRTTSAGRYCSAFPRNEGDLRFADKTDADCVALGFPPESACAPVSRGICAGACPTGMACLVPCGVELP